jgi:quercetin dioxygenase-like cupin family protein
MTRRTLGLALILLLASSSALVARAQEVVMVTNPDQLKWTPLPSPAPPGELMAILAGNPAEGAWTIRLKSPPGAIVVPHFHPMTENVTVISGDFHLGVGDRLDKTSGTLFEAGSFFSAPPGTHLYGWTENGAVLQVHSDKPMGRTLLEAAHH